MNKKIVIIAGGRLIPVPLLKAEMQSCDFIIAVNGGLSNASKLEVTPDLVIGDMDSAPAISINIPAKIYPQQKDYTDLELALEHAFTLNPEFITLMGALGDRIDHSLANLFLLNRIPFPVGKILTEEAEIFLLVKSTIFSAQVGSIISLLPLSDNVEEIFMDGVYYPLLGETLSFGQCRGISNIAIEREVKISFTRGKLLVIKYFKTEV